MCPLYDCECESCGNVSEFILNRDEEPGPCGHCDGDVKKVPVQTGSTFELKGSCWERDGYSTTVGDSAKYNRRP